MDVWVYLVIASNGFGSLYYIYSTHKISILPHVPNTKFRAKHASGNTRCPLPGLSVTWRRPWNDPAVAVLRFQTLCHQQCIRSLFCSGRTLTFGSSQTYQISTNTLGAANIFGFLNCGSHISPKLSPRRLLEGQNPENTMIGHIFGTYFNIFWNCFNRCMEKFGCRCFEKNHPYWNRINPVLYPYYPVFSYGNLGFSRETPGLP